MFLMQLKFSVVTSYVDKLTSPQGQARYTSFGRLIVLLLYDRIIQKSGLYINYIRIDQLDLRKSLM